ncbi:hypothetical protein TIFTF001_054896 [Ficus carica]|uniref:Uncharacterized protein n=1 Tax=Ficus carica TaxID=3494 RepID=A0AA88ELB8_FICCA|nr:hypothetical protein TIFTF001_054896 [Ficus carica]
MIWRPSSDYVLQGRIFKLCYVCQPTTRRGGSSMVPWHEGLERSTANGSELRSESVVDKLSLQYDMI